jgi:HAD superfamily 5'-nucleotidase-like hydrolase
MTEPDDASAMPPPERRIYCNRTLNLRAIRAIGYDLDYTLVHYRVEPWERRAYRELQDKLAAQGLPVGDLEFDAELVTRGLVVDTELGNLVKANRFGYVTRAAHGTRLLSFDELRGAYGRTLVDLGEPRWVFLNTLFELSEGCMFVQLVDRLDAGRLPAGLGYPELYRAVRKGLDEAHLEGELKGDIVADPEAYLEPDPEVAPALLDQREAGKALLVVTNSDWPYARRMLDVTLQPFLPAGVRWRELFTLVICSARKPDFFSRRMPAFEVTGDGELLRAAPGGIRAAGVWIGGDATQVQEFLGVPGEDILYVGDHVVTDVQVTKAVLRWRTALVLRELEAELGALASFRDRQAELARLMDEKVRLEHAMSRARLGLLRAEKRYAAAPAPAGALRGQIARQREAIAALDERIGPLARDSGELLNRRWGLLMRAGNDKSLLARQVEGFADVYTSRVSNFLFETPFSYLRAPRGSLPHDDAPLLD